jgi:hypothetical protein
MMSIMYAGLFQGVRMEGLSKDDVLSIAGLLAATRAR